MKNVVLLVGQLVALLAFVAIAELVSGYLACFLLGVLGAVGWVRGVKEGVFTGRMWQVQRERRPAMFRLVVVFQGVCALAPIIVPLLVWRSGIYIGSPK